MSTALRIDRLKDHDEEGGRFWIEAADDVLIIAVTDPTGKILYANDRFCSISGYSSDELVGANHRILNSGTHGRTFFRDMFRTIHRGEIWRGEICNRAKNGSLYWVATTIIPETGEDGRVRRFVSCRFDITEQKLAEQRLRETSVTDALTGLLNRRGFQQRFTELLEVAKEHSDELVVLMLDVDHFKDINDANGHDAGDLFLREICRRLQSILTPSDVIARVGGDEIAIVLPLGARAPMLDYLIRSLQQAVRYPIDLGETTVTSTVSIGLAMFPLDADNVGDLTKSADVALVAAKRGGRDRCCRFAPAMLEKSRRRIALQEQARSGLANGEFELFYQPIIALDRSEAAACEALLRWRHPEHGLLAPGQFAELFDHHGISVSIGDFVQRAVIEQAWKWQQADVPFSKIKYNTTSADFEAPDYSRRLLSGLAARGLSVDRIGVEVTEGMFLGQNAGAIKQELVALNKAGVETAFDDFGTGYASLTHLRELPITRIKVDRSFIANLAEDRNDQKIVAALIALAHNLGITVTAEGIETTQQLAILKEMGCDRVQGYLIARPCPADEMTTLLTTISSSLWSTAA